MEKVAQAAAVSVYAPNSESRMHSRPLNALSYLDIDSR
jgi:hypothetical protein